MTPEEDYLVVVSGPAAGSRLDVEGGLLVGRSGSQHGRLGGDSSLSRRHALLSRTGDRLTIVDLGSTNGTRVNGHLITAPTELNTGDRVELGASVLEVHGPRPPAAAGGGRIGPGAAGVPPLALPPVDRRAAGGVGRAPVVLLSALLVAAVAAAVVGFMTRSSVSAPASRSASVSGGDWGNRPYDGTVYVETNTPAPGQNSVVAMRYRAGSFRPLQIAEYPTGGTGSHDLGNRGVLDADQQVITNDSKTLLFAINQGSDSVAVFHIESDGSLRAVSGSPFPSGGTAPGSLGISGNILIVANKAHDGIRDLTHTQANYTTFRVASDGALRPTGSTFVLPPKSSPTQAFVASGGRLVFTTEETGLLRAFQLTRSGKLIEAPGSPHPLPASLFARGQRPHVVWPAGLSADGHSHVLYTGIPNYGSIAAYSYDADGSLRLDGGESDPNAFLPCWSVVSRDGQRLYFANAGTDNISVWDIASDPQHPRLLQTVPLRGGGNPWNLVLSESGKFLFIITPRQVRLIPAGQGQVLHSLAVGSDGRLRELPSSPVPLPVFRTNPLGLALVPHR